MEKEYQAQPGPLPTHDLSNVAPLLWVLWNHLGARSPVGQPIREYLGMGQFQPMTDAQMAAANQYRALLWNSPQPEPAGQIPPDYIDPQHTGADRELLQAFYAACQSEGGTADEVTLRGLRAAIAADRAQPQPVPGEVQELVEWLYCLADKLTCNRRRGIRPHPSALTRAADLLAQRYPQPVPVSERLPEPGVKVLAHYLNDLGEGRTVCAIWVPAKSRTEEGDLDSDDFLEYDEEDDKFYWPEGWYEAIENWEELGWVRIYEGEIVYWQPLPQWPAHALPLPVEVEG